MEADILTQIGGWATVTPSALLLVLGGLFLRAVMVGTIVPRKTYEDMREERDHYRRADDVHKETLREMAKQVDAIAEISTTSLRFIESVQRVARPDRERS